MQNPKTDADFMQLALEQARKSYEKGSFPIGSVLVRNGQVISTGRNMMLETKDITSHSEIECLRVSGLQDTFLDTVMYTTMSPCLMCTGAILQFKIPKVVIGTAIASEGHEELLQKRGVEVVILDNQACYDVMVEYSKEKMPVWAQTPEQALNQ